MRSSRSSRTIRLLCFLESDAELHHIYWDPEVSSATPFREEEVKSGEETRLERGRLPGGRREVGEDTRGRTSWEGEGASGRPGLDLWRAAREGVRDTDARLRVPARGRMREESGGSRLRAPVDQGSLILADRDGAARACVWRERERGTTQTRRR
jgi:hypothetical protein